MNRKKISKLIFVIIILLCTLLFVNLFLFNIFKEKDEKKANLIYYSFANTNENTDKEILFEKNNDLRITLYNQNFGLINEINQFELKKGTNYLRYENIPKTIDSKTLMFNDIENKAKLLEFKYNYDIDNEDTLLEKTIGNTIMIVTKQGSGFEGKLLHYGNFILLETANGVVSINREQIESINFGELKLDTKPILELKINIDNDSVIKAMVSYLARGLNWKAKYNGKLNDNKLSLEGLIIIENNSGKDYKNAIVTLIAGDIIRKQDDIPRAYYPEKEAVAPLIVEEAPKKQFFEYYLYPLKDRLTLNDKEKIQLKMLKAENINVTKEYVLEKYSDDKITIKIRFKNSQENGLGIALPEGIISLYKEEENVLQFIGEDSIANTPKNKEIILAVGKAFDITANRKIIKVEPIGDNCRKRNYEVEILNSKKHDIVVYVMQDVYGNITIAKSTHKYEDEDAYTKRFIVPVKAESESKLNYEITSCW